MPILTFYAVSNVMTRIKMLVTLLLLSLSGLITNGQTSVFHFENNSTLRAPDYYYPPVNIHYNQAGVVSNPKKMETWGWVTMGAGASLITLGAPGLISALSLGEHPANISKILAGTGAALVGLSIPLIITSNQYYKMPPYNNFTAEDLASFERRWKKLRKFGWISLGVGVPLVILSYGAVFAAVANGSGGSTVGGFDGTIILNATVFTGLVLTGASIPLFIAARHFKNRSAKVRTSLSPEVISVARMSNSFSTVQPALVLKIQF